MKNPVKNKMTFLLAALLAAGSASAASVTATDGGTAVYGACNGFAIDFDASVAPSAVWSPPLTNGEIYVLNSVAVKNSTGNSGSYYLGVYTGYSGGVLSGFQGVSDAANDFSTSANNWLSFTFSNLDYDVTVDSTVGSGSGLLYFVYQSGTSAVSSPGVTLATDKFGADTYMSNSLAGIIAYGGLVANRSPQYQATITSTLPTQPPSTPTGLIATGSNAAVVLSWAASSGATSYNVKRSLTSGSELTVSNVTGTRMVDVGLVNGTTYYYTVSATNYLGESTNSTEVSATPLPPPAAPTDVSVAVSKLTATLTWTASSGATSYNVKRSLNSGSGYTTIANVTGTNAMDGSLAYNTTYYYTVSALSSSGEGGDSGEVSATTAGLPDSVTISNLVGVSVMVGTNGVYQVNFTSPKWVFLGDLSRAQVNRNIQTGIDRIGNYSEIAFNYTSTVPHTASIRLYDTSPVIIFNDTTLAAGINDLAFPQWVSYPQTSSHLTFGENAFAEYTFKNLHDDSPGIFFNTNHDTFILSAATNYMVASTVMKNTSSISCGINSAITQLPSGFTHRSILTAQNGIDQCYTTWGNALMALAGKTPPANDAAVELEKLGYWTDNGATYYYNINQPLGIQNTLIAIRDEYASKGVPLGYVQLDSWWYQKGSNATWNSSGGIYLYEPDPTLFPTGLADFQQRLGLPLITHSRWIDASSPYRTNYTMSANVITDMRYWTNRMAYLKSCGVVTFEQDWLSVNGTPAMSLTDGGSAYLGNMQAAAAANGINLQYCMNQGRTFMQGSLYNNLMTVRDSYDRFNSNRWKAFLFGSRIVHALGVWPWCDVFMSSETRNLLLATLSCGPVGPGDALNAVDAANLKQSARSDGVIVKPDEPLVPTEDTYVNDALGLGQPFIATGFTDHTNSLALYVFAFGEDASKLSGSFKPADFGIANNAYVYDYFAATGMVVSAGSTFNFTTTMPNDTNGGSYFIAVPIGSSGIAFLGDTNKFVTRGKKRIAEFTDTGVLRATVAFAAGETNVTLSGYAPKNPYVLAAAGVTNGLTYDTTTHLFTLNVSPDNSGTATVALSLAPLPSLQVTPVIGGQFQVSWPADAIGYLLEKTTNLSPPVVWSQSSDPVVSTNGWNVVTVTNSNSAAFYRLKQ